MMHTVHYQEIIDGIRYERKQKILREPKHWRNKADPNVQDTKSKEIEKLKL